MLSELESYCSLKVQVPTESLESQLASSTWFLHTSLIETHAVSALLVPLLVSLGRQPLIPEGYLWSLGSYEDEVQS